MEYCEYCGRILRNGRCICPEYQAAARKKHFLIERFKPDFHSWSGFFSSIRDLSGMSEAPMAAGNPYERELPIVPDCIEAEENEIPVKQYNIAKLRTRLKFMRAEGRLMVTNRRILFRAAGTSLTGNIIQEHQFTLDELAGVEMHKDYKFNLLNFIGSILLLNLTTFLVLLLAAWIVANVNPLGAMFIGVILASLFIAPSFFIYKHFWLKLFLSIFGAGCMTLAAAVSGWKWYMIVLLVLAFIVLIVNLVIVCFVPNLVLKIKAKGAQGAVIIGSQKSIGNRRTGDDYSGFAEVLPWDDTIIAMNELGTLIDDLQKQGDYAVEKWT